MSFKKLFTEGPFKKGLIGEFLRKRDEMKEEGGILNGISYLKRLFLLVGAIVISVTIGIFLPFTLFAIPVILVVSLIIGWLDD